MNDFGLKKNRFQQQAQIKKQNSIERQNNLEKQQQKKITKQKQFESKPIENRKESITFIDSTTPIKECHVPIFEPAKFINDIKNKKL